jgi:nucleoside-diphosphate-sugar epimerase
MAPIPERGMVAVTGAAGYIGGWVVKLLLDDGYRVRACVREPSNDTKTAFLKAMPGYASGRLTLHAADLDNDGCFDPIFAGCNGVAHVSHVSTYNDQDYVARVCAHVIESVEKSETVTRVVLTSSVAAVISEMDLQEIVRRPVFYEDRFPDERNARRTVERGQGYSMGKLVAERAFTEAAAASGRWDVITVCPGDNLGPILSAHQQERGAWQSQIAGMLQGRYGQNGVYRPWMTVDVRDCALCHVRLLGRDGVRNGERYIAWSTDARDVEQICRDIDRLLPELNHEWTPPIDGQNERIKAREAEFRAIWAKADLRNERMRTATGVTFRPLDESIRDCAESLLALASIQVKRRAPAEAAPEPVSA